MVYSREVFDSANVHWSSERRRTMTQNPKKPSQRPRVGAPRSVRRSAAGSAAPTKRPASTGQSLATFTGRWAGDDLDERLAEVYQLRGQVVAD
jgi:hypothetical protein